MGNSKVGKQKAIAVNNAILLDVIRRLLDTLVDVVEHAPNLAAWAAAYAICRQYGKKGNFLLMSRNIQHVEFAERYLKILNVIDEAKTVLEKSNG